MEEQKKKRSPLGIILLILLLLLAGGAGFLYYSVVKAPLTLDDPVAMAAAQPMSPEERFTFSPDGTVQMKLDAGDCWDLVLSHAGEDFLEVVNGELSSYGLSVSGAAITMKQEGLGLDLELFYQETRLVARVPLSLEISGKHLSLAPSGVKLGLISLPVKGLLSNLKFGWDMELPVISQVQQVSFTEGALVLTGEMEDIRSLVPREERLYQAAVFSGSLQGLGDALLAQDGSILPGLEEAPGSVEALYRDLFTLAGPEVTQGYLDSRLGLTQRAFPGIDFSAVAEKQATFGEEMDQKSTMLQQFFTEIVNDYNEKEFRLADGEFIRKKTPFHPSQYGNGKYDELFAFLDPDSMFLVLVDAQDGFIRKTSSFYRLCDENQQFTREIDFNRTYILGLVFRGVDGDPFLMYETEIQKNNTYSRSFRLVSLTEEALAELQVPGKFGVYVG